MKLVPVHVICEFATDDRGTVTVEYEIVKDNRKSGRGLPFALDHRIYELPEVLPVPVLEEAER